MNIPAISDQYLNRSKKHESGSQSWLKDLPTDSPTKNTNVKSTETPPPAGLNIATKQTNSNRLKISTVEYQEIQHASPKNNTNTKSKETKAHSEKIETTETQTTHENITRLKKKIESTFNPQNYDLSNKFQKKEFKDSAFNDKTSPNKYDDYACAIKFFKKKDYLRSCLLIFNLFSERYDKEKSMSKKSDELDKESHQQINEMIIRINLDKCTREAFRALVTHLLNKEYDEFETKLKNENLTFDHNSTDQNKNSLSVLSNNEEINQSDQKINSLSALSRNEEGNERNKPTTLSPKKSKSSPNLNQIYNATKKIKAN